MAASIIETADNFFYPKEYGYLTPLLQFYIVTCKNDLSFIRAFLTLMRDFSLLLLYV